LFSCCNIDIIKHQPGIEKKIGNFVENLALNTLTAIFS
jgi:hypothetical protein